MHSALTPLEAESRQPHTTD